MAVPVPRTYIASEFVSATILNADIRDIHNWLLNPPHVLCYRAANKGTGAGYILYDMDQELYDWSTSSMHSTITNNSRLSAPEPGVYFISAAIRWDAATGGSRDLLIRANAAGISTAGTAIIEKFTLPAGGNVGFAHWSGDFPLNAGDYIEMWTRQTAGGTVDVLNGVHNTYLSMRWSSKQ